jgi:hypothetical protein
MSTTTDEEAVNVLVVGVELGHSKHFAEAISKDSFPESQIAGGGNVLKNVPQFWIFDSLFLSVSPSLDIQQLKTVLV